MTTLFLVSHSSWVLMLFLTMKTLRLGLRKLIPMVLRLLSALFAAMLDILVSPVVMSLMSLPQL